MAFELTTVKIRSALESVACGVDEWFERPADTRRYRRANGGWSIDQILEHVTLTNRFLLMTCEKHQRIALHRARRGDVVPQTESDLERMAEIGERGSFPWIRPEHMEPTGEPSLEEVRELMRAQWRTCHEILDSLSRGMGALCHVTMTVNSLGKIDLYQWLYFIAQHAQRHTQQMAAVEAEFECGRRLS